MAITAQQILDRMQGNLGVPWNVQTVDTFHSGKPDSAVTGVVTTFAPSFDVMRRAIAAKKNMIVCRESPFWTRGVPPGSQRANQARAALEELAKNATFQAKREFIDKNGLIIYRLAGNWDARKQDPQLLGLARALGWEKFYKPSAGERWARNNGFFSLPSATLKETAQSVKERLRMKSIRIIGKPETTVNRAALSTGMYTVAQLGKHLADPGVDLIVIGEPVEWEASPYMADVVASGQKKGMLVLGQEVSEEPGCGLMADWLKIFVTEVPVEWIPAGEPAWMPY